MVTNKSLTVQGVEVGLTAKGDEDYISLTDWSIRRSLAKVQYRV
jgi:hypothetical protein